MAEQQSDSTGNCKTVIEYENTEEEDSISDGCNVDPPNMALCFSEDDKCGAKGGNLENDILFFNSKIEIKTVILLSY